jgi:creatinine amidohydrolase
VVIPTGIAERVARNIGGLVAPTLAYGYKSQPRSGGGESFPGTTSLDGNTFALVVRDVIRSLGRDGVRRIVVLNGHFENMWPSVEGVDLGLRELQRDGIADMQLMRLEYWDFISRSTLDKLFPDGFPGTDLEHASLLETSLMLVLRPDLVDMSNVPNDGPATFPTYDRHPVPPGFVPKSGVLARAERATAEYGQLIIADHVKLISEAIRKEFKL